MMTTNKITHAPQAVIDELDIYPGTTPDRFLIDVGRLSRFENVNKWISKRDFTARQLAIINHVYGDEKLLPERELKYYVVTKDGENDTVTYYRDRHLNMLDRAWSRVELAYDEGLSKQLAEAIVADFGGEIEEIK